MTKEEQLRIAIEAILRKFKVALFMYNGKLSGYPKQKVIINSYVNELLTEVKIRTKI